MTLVSCFALVFFLVAPFLISQDSPNILCRCTYHLIIFHTSVLPTGMCYIVHHRCKTTLLLHIHTSTMLLNSTFNPETPPHHCGFSFQIYPFSHLGCTLSPSLHFAKVRFLFQPQMLLLYFLYLFSGRDADC